MAICRIYKSYIDEFYEKCYNIFNICEWKTFWQIINEHDKTKAFIYDAKSAMSCEIKICYLTWMISKNTLG